jgi:hypothetical protein
MKELIAVLTLLVICACSVLPLEKGDKTLEFTVRAVAARTFTEHPTWAPAAQTIAHQIRTADTEIEVGLLTDAVFERIPVDALTPEETALIHMLVPALEIRIVDRLKEKGVETPEKTRAYLGEVLWWIEQTAQAYR